MDWDGIIEGKGEALGRCVERLLEMVRLGSRIEPVPAEGVAGDRRPAGAAMATVTRYLHSAILRLLRPTEAAVRRLVMIAARDIEVVLAPARAPKPKAAPTILPRGTFGTGLVLSYRARMAMRPVRAAPTRLPFPLLDPIPSCALPRRRSAIASSGVPRILCPGIGEPFAVRPWHPPAPDDEIDSSRLLLRLQAVAGALDDLPAQALRFARWRARCDRAVRAGRRHRSAPLRPGRPPGIPRRLSRRRADEIHDHLRDLQYFAREALEPHDTS